MLVMWTFSEHHWLIPLDSLSDFNHSCMKQGYPPPPLSALSPPLLKLVKQCNYLTPNKLPPKRVHTIAFFHQLLSLPAAALRFKMSSEKNDVFVGNVTFNTTEEQLRDIFGVVGAIKNIRILQDKETGRPKGFAFIEYMDANTALAAIRNLDGTELNGRRLRVSYSNNSNLREMAKLIGQDVTEVTTSRNDSNQAVSNLQLYEAWDILDLLKKMADEDRGDKIRQLLEGYPQLVGAVNQIQVVVT